MSSFNKTTTPTKGNKEVINLMDDVTTDDLLNLSTVASDSKIDHNDGEEPKNTTSINPVPSKPKKGVEASKWASAPDEPEKKPTSNPAERKKGRTYGSKPGKKEKKEKKEKRELPAWMTKKDGDKDSDGSAGAGTEDLIEL